MKNTRLLLLVFCGWNLHANTVLGFPYSFPNCYNEACSPDPCHAKTCEIRPVAVCRSSMCRDKCEWGFFEGDKLVSCTGYRNPCPIGHWHWAEGGSSECLPCPPGSYRPASSETCISCPQHYTTTRGGASVFEDCTPIETCEPGWYHDATGRCHQCAEGYYQWRDDSDFCEQCPDGKTSPAGAKAEHECRFGSTCSAGNYRLSNGECRPCVHGTYQDQEDRDQCKNCPSGMTTDSSASYSVDLCKYQTTCRAGHYRRQDGTCERCGLGYWQDQENQNSCKQCSGGRTTRDGGAVTDALCIHETNCGTGSYRMGNGNCNTCDRGYYQDRDDEADCERCPPGMTTDQAGSTSVTHCHYATACQAGYKRDTSDGSCQPCPRGHYQTQEDKDFCDPCPAGMTTYDVATGSQDNCRYENSCSRGTYRITSDGSCKACPIGQYQPDENKLECVDCPSGKTTHTTGCDTVDLCQYEVNCNRGYQRQESDGSCVVCDIGYYQDRENQLQCTQCPNGMTTHRTGCESADLCYYKDACMPGSYRQGNGLCDECPLGYYQPEADKTECIKCQPGQTTEHLGCSRIDQCHYQVTCEAGSKRETHNGQCAECPRGYYQDQRDRLECIQCPDSKTTANTGCDSVDLCVHQCQKGTHASQFGCRSCDKGYYQPNDNAQNCYQCPIDKTTSGTGSIYASDCFYTTTCYAGYYHSASGCTQCPKGHYQFRLDEDHCKKCKYGKTTRSPGATMESKCFWDSQCEPGKYWTEDGGACIPCEKGTVQPAYNGITCVSCPYGQTTPGAGSSSFGNCYYEYVCEPGHFRLENGTCTKCPVGHYQSASNQNFCHRCADDKVTNFGAIHSHECRFGATCMPGSYRDDGGDCQECGRGYYQTYQNARTCVKCPSDQTSNKGAKGPNECFYRNTCHPGSYRTSSGNCELCSAGYFQDEADQITCEMCPPGKTTNNHGAISDDECQWISACYEGTYRKVETGACAACHQGYYQETRDAESCVKCPNGKTTSGTGTTRAQDCFYGTLCGRGQYRTNDGECALCDEGYYQDRDEQSQCTQCPNGKMTSQMGAYFASDCVYETTCEAGSYRTSSGGCEQCGRGQYQANQNAASCLSCASEATTSSMGSISADACYYTDVCQSGSYRANSGHCNRCSVGYYQDQADSTDCAKCPDGQTTSSDGARSRNDCSWANTCQAGSYRSEAGNCLACHHGYYQGAENADECSECPPGKTTPQVGATSMADCQYAIPCTAGQYRLDLDGLCYLCDKGWYQPSPNAYYCIECSAGKTTSGPGGTKPEDCFYSDTCNSGSYRVADSGGCSTCQKGYYQQGQNRFECHQCPGGKTTQNSGASSINDCYWENSCTAGSYRGSGGDCVICDKGHYQPYENRDVCMPCPQGMTTSGPGTHNQEDCYFVDDCTPGHYRLSSGDCTLCAKGYYQDQHNVNYCHECPNKKTTDNAGATNPNDCHWGTTCQAGSYRSDSGDCLACHNGYYQDSENANECHQCPTGKYTRQVGSTSEDDCYYVNTCYAGWYRSGDGSCRQCDKGWYQSQQNQNNCHQCLAGKTTQGSGATREEDCHYSTTCNSGSYRVADTGSCTQCAKGYYQHGQNTYECQQCPTGKTTQGQGATSINDCYWGSACTAGSYRGSGGDCVICDKGHYQPYDNRDVCMPCPQHMTTSGPGAHNQDECYYIIDCLPGNYRQSNGECRKCTKGYYQHQPNRNYCVRCPDRQTTPGDGSASELDCDWENTCQAGSYRASGGACLECAPGYYQSDQNTNTCLKCPSGKITANVGATSIDDCYYAETCYAGSFRTSDGPCQICERGKYQPEDNKSFCNDCPPGKSTIATGSAHESACYYATTCGAGSYRVMDTGGCNDCQKGYYQQGLNQPECHKCPAGKTTQGQGATTVNDCYWGSTCDSGSYRGSGGACVICDKGHYQPYENRDVCMPCHQGMTTSGSGAQNQNECYYSTDCNPGSYRMSNGDCRQCARTYYQDQPNRDYCHRCSSGKTTPGEGATTESDCYWATTCEAGSYRASGGNCLVCARGHYQASENAGDCLQCPGGKTTPNTGATTEDDCYYSNTCYPGQYRASDGSCPQCPKDYYQPEQNIGQCLKCGPGKTTSSAGAYQESSCVYSSTCQAGSYRKEDTGNCAQCAKGYYQQGQNRLECFECPAGKTTQGQGATTSNDCYWADTCGKGTYRVSGGACDVCDKGHYQPYENRDVCMPCPAKMTTSGSGAHNQDDCYYDPPCNAGYYRASSNLECHACPRGYYTSKAEQGACLKCEDWQTTAGPGSSSASECYYEENCNSGSYRQTDGDCVTCPKDHYQDAHNTLKCIACPDGLVTAGTGATSLGACHHDADCEAGTYIANGGTCEPCRVGYYQHLRNQGYCLRCGRGRITASTGSTSPADCYHSDTCPKGHSIRINGDCKECSEGYYQESENAYKCEKCPGDQTTRYLGAASVDDCYTPIDVVTAEVCTPGNYLMANGDCNECGVGYYQPESDKDDCLQCPSGKTTKNRGTTSSDSCIWENACQAGSYHLADGACEECDMGYYQANEGQDNCDKCPEGQTTLSSGEVSADACHSDGCPAGTFRAPDSTCYDCPKRTYQNEADQPICKFCPDNKITRSSGAKSVDQCIDAVCEPGTHRGDDDQCHECALGTYQPTDDATECRTCPDNTTTRDTGSRSQNDCIGPRQDDICVLPADIGPCKAIHERFFFNPETRMCESFSYGGCDGNQNNFASFDDCMNSCRCHLGWDKGSCQTPGAFVVRFYYHMGQRTCKLFYFTECDGNPNRFVRKSDCMEQCG